MTALVQRPGGLLKYLKIVAKYISVDNL